MNYMENRITTDEMIVLLGSDTQAYALLINGVIVCRMLGYNPNGYYNKSGYKEGNPFLTIDLDRDIYLRDYKYMLEKTQGHKIIKFYYDDNAGPIEVYEKLHGFSIKDSENRSWSISPLFQLDNPAKFVKTNKWFIKTFERFSHYM